MTTEATLQHNSETVAAANYGNAQSLAGPSGSGQFLAVALSQSADRTSVLASVAGQQIWGILQNKPATGDAADVATGGITKAMVGTGGTTRGKPQMVTAAGAITDWTAGSGYSQIGYAIESGVAGVLVALSLNVPSPKVLT